MAASAISAALAQTLVRNATEKRRRIVTAESCTGGMIGAAITDIPGASAVFDRGFIAYSNEAKTELLDVPAALIARRGAVSAEVVEAMAHGALRRSSADIAVAVTGVAGPGGGTPDKPVGLVWFGLATRNGERAESRIFAGGGRDYVRTRTVEAALTMLLQTLAAEF